MRILITQPAEDSEVTAAVLRARGHAVVNAPLITAERLSSPKINLSAAQGFVVTSGEGARALADHVGVRTFPVFTDSAATAAVLRRLGYQQILVARDDTADLARLVERSVIPSGGALIHACSNGPAGNLGALLGNMGFALRPLALYSLKRASALPDDIAVALREKALDAAVFLSPEDARAFVALVQQEKLDGAIKNLAAVAASPAVAAPLRALKFRGVTVPPGGTLEDIAAALDSALIDKVEEQRAAAEQHAKAAAAREAAVAREQEAQRLAAEQAEQDRRARLAAEEEQRRRAEAAKEETDRQRVAAEQERERQRQEREALAAAEREAREKERLAHQQAAQEEAARKRIAEEQAWAEREARREQRRLEEEARVAAKRAAEEQARLILEKAAKEAAERKRLAEEEAQAEREAKRAAEEKVRIAREQSAKEEVERRRIAEEQARAEREAKIELKRLEDEARRRAQAEADEKARRVREQVAKEEAERRRIEEEQERLDLETRREQQRQEAAAQAAAAEEAGREERRRAEEARLKAARLDAEREHVLAEAAELARQKDEAIAIAQAREAQSLQTQRERQDLQSEAAEDAAPAGFGAGLKTWWAKIFASGSAAAAIPPRPSWIAMRAEATDADARIRDDSPSTPPAGASDAPAQALPQLSDTPNRAEGSPPQVLAPHAASATMAPVLAPIPVDDGAPPPEAPPENQPEMSPEPTVTQSLSSAPESDIAAPADGEAAPPRPADAPRAGRAARLLAEDAADDKARGQRFKNYSFGDGAEAPPESERRDAESPPRRRSRAPAVLLVLAVLAVGAYLSSSWWRPKLTPVSQAPVTTQNAAPAAGDDATALAARVRAMEEKAAADAAELAAAKRALSEQTPQAGAPGEVDESVANQGRQVAALTARVATLEAAIGNAARLDELNKRMGALEGKSADAASVLALSERVNALEGAARSAANAQATAVAYLMALGQWQNALAGGRPFALELETAKALAARGNGTINDAGFADYAARGLPTAVDLRAQFDPVAAAAVRAAAVPDDTAGWLRRALDRIMSIVTIRRVDGDVEGNSAWAIVARAESRLAQNDLAGAVAEMEKLQGEAARAAAPWVGPARARLEAERTLSEATTKAIAAVAAAGDKPGN